MCLPAKCLDDANRRKVPPLHWILLFIQCYLDAVYYILNANTTIKPNSLSSQFSQALNGLCLGEVEAPVFLISISLVPAKTWEQARSWVTI